ncbi:MAG: DUF1365 domain-containing protein [Planctomycetes bacterium]|nr:DUF1365 domain-containing protein [Planctomycetota bacterium]
MTHNAIYEGSVYHRRTEPRPHEFRYRIYMLYLDLDALPAWLNGGSVWSWLSRAAVWFRRADYMGPTNMPLKQAVLDRVEQTIGRRPAGAVRILTHARTLGYVFNPVTFYYCFDLQDELEAVAAEITNTPWRERHTYVLDARATEDRQRVAARFRKEFHISPFHGMNLEYDWKFHTPEELLTVAMANFKEGKAVFHAGLVGERRPFSIASLASAMIRHPLLTLRMHAAIYWQAARLWMKRTPFHSHPDHSPALPDTRTT